MNDIHLLMASLSNLAISTVPNISLPLALIGVTITSRLISHFRCIPRIFLLEHYVASRMKCPGIWLSRRKQF